MATPNPVGNGVEPTKVDITTFLGVIWGGLAIAVIFVFIRIIARIRAFKKLYMDDALVIFALTLALVRAILWQIFAKDMFQMMAVASRRQLPGPTFIADSEGYSKASTAVIVLYYSTLWAIKISFLIFFRRLVKNVRRQELLWWPVFGFTIATYFACIGTIQYSCLVVPHEQVLANCTKDAAVNSQQFTLKLNCAWDVITDFSIMLIPISMLWGTQMRLRRKLALAGIFSLVIITIIFAIVRTTVVGSLTRMPDTSWLHMWSAIETTIAITVSCLASFRSLFSHQDSGSQPIKYNPSASRNIFHQGGNSGRSRMKFTLDSQTGTSSHKTHIQSQSMDPRNMDRDDSSTEFIIPLEGVHIKHEVGLSHEPV